MLSDQRLVHKTVVVKFVLSGICKFYDPQSTLLCSSSPCVPTQDLCHMTVLVPLYVAHVL